MPRRISGGEPPYSTFATTFCHGMSDSSVSMLSRSVCTYLADHCTSLNHRALLDRDASVNDHSRSDVAILFNSDGSADGQTTTSTSCTRVHRQRHGVKFDVRTDNRSRTDSNTARILHEAIGLNDDMITNVNIVSVFTFERRLYHEMLPNGSTNSALSRTSTCLAWHDYCPEKSTALFLTSTLTRPGSIVVSFKSSSAIVAIIKKGWIIKLPIWSASQHSGPLGIEACIGGICRGNHTDLSCWLNLSGHHRGWARGCNCV